MKFELSDTKGIYNINDKEVEEFTKLGFKFRKSESKSTLIDEDDLFIEGTPTIELNSLEELMNFTRKWGKIVLNNDTIEIYNDYRE